jgi:hypothetical protein
MAVDISNRKKTALLSALLRGARLSLQLRDKKLLHGLVPFQGWRRYLLMAL